ncbi:MAG: hypothetical protein NTW28_05895 [Candidatus Solibacter sp.]|nr:hypothetical protein [Candidatus Solibacter sp.]
MCSPHRINSLPHRSRADADDFPTTPGALQPKLAGTAAPYQRSTDGFASKPGILVLRQELAFR